MPLKTKKKEGRKETLNRNRCGNNYIQKYSFCGFSLQTIQEVSIFILNHNGSFPIAHYSNESNAVMLENYTAKKMEK